MKHNKITKKPNMLCGLMFGDDSDAVKVTKWEFVIGKERELVSKVCGMSYKELFGDKD